MGRRIEPTQLLYRPEDSVSVWPAIAARGRGNQNINVVDLPKGGGRSVVWGDPTLIFVCAALEPDAGVASYVADYNRLYALTQAAGFREGDVSVTVAYADGKREWCKVVEHSTSKDDSGELPPLQDGESFCVRSLAQLGDWRVKFDNWLTICRWIANTRCIDWGAQFACVQHLLRLHSSVTLGMLLERSDDPGATLGVVARLLHAGTVEAELETELISPATCLSWSSREQRQDIGLSSAASIAPTESEPVSFQTAEREPRRGRPRSLTGGSNNVTSGWPEPDVSMLPLDKRHDYYMRKDAITLYLADAPACLIWSETGISMKDVRRLLKRCLSRDPSERVYGFFALLPGSRLQGYHRKARIDPRRSQKSWGCAGALGQCLERFPEVWAWLNDQISAARRRKSGGIYGCHALKREFLTKLRSCGLSQEDWPFCRTDEGYQALRMYVKHFLLARDAKRGSMSSSRSEEGALIKPLRPMSILQLDYQVAGAACVLRLQNAYGKILRVPIHRWYLGVVGDEDLHAILGVSIEFDIAPSADTALDAISSVLSPEDDEIYNDHLRYTADGKFLLRHFFPQLGWHGFAMLRVDNAWGNKAHDFVNNVIDTVGCVIQFGPAYQWWVRSFIESLIGLLDARGLSRLPSTYGTGPEDPRRRNPEKAAVDLVVDVGDIQDVVFGACAQLNLSPGESHQKSSRVEAMRAALDCPERGCFVQPLPKLTQRHHHLLYHVERRTIRGGGATRERPYIKVDRCRYTSKDLLPHLVGCKVWIYIYRKDARFAIAFLCDTGKCLGELRVTGAWARSPFSWRTRKLINRGTPADDVPPMADPVRRWEEDKCREAASRKHSANVSAGAALSLVAHGQSKRHSRRAEQTDTELAPVQEASTETTESLRHGDPYGFRKAPRLDD